MKHLDLDKSIVIVGMMGCGKSYIGQELAKRLGLSFFDTDQEIEKEQGCLIAQIFEDSGEQHFRRLEKQKLNELLQQGVSVIATGGGLVTSIENLKAIEDYTISIWLKSRIETIMSRLDGDGSRPLLQTKNPTETLEVLLKEREPLYSKADIHIDNDGDAETVIDKIEQKLGRVA